ncbi:MAG: peptidylprolyl isomerase [Oscillospiraceae bacterium]|nr:peptidylprolyl isomerase [Oscillospiraceae bacterium]
MIRIELENGKNIDIELDFKAAPLTAANFEKLVREGFYDGLGFHRVIEGFMIQGGCPLGNGTGGADENIKGEFAQNGIENPLKHKRGVISMARSANPDSASSQFFIMHADSPHLDGAYAAFGRVTQGMEAVDEIAACEVDYSDKPLKPQMMRRVYVVE